MNFHINSIESFSAHPDGHSCLDTSAGKKKAATQNHPHNNYTIPRQYNPSTSRQEAPRFFSDTDRPEVDPTAHTATRDTA